MANPDVYPNMPPKNLERYFEREAPWHPQHGSGLYDEPAPTPDEP